MILGGVFYGEEWDGEGGRCSWICCCTGKYLVYVGMGIKIGE